jgi:hypothetical protein
MTTNTISNHVATLQELAAQLPEAQSDHQRLDALLDKISRVSSRCSLVIEDAPSRIAHYQFNDIGKDSVTIRQLAVSLFGNSPFHQGQMIRELRYYLQTKKVAGFIKNKQWYCNHATLAEYYRERIRRDDERRQRIAELAEPPKMAA